MAIIGSITTEGLDKIRFATLNEGFRIDIDSFRVARVATPGGIPAIVDLDMNDVDTSPITDDTWYTGAAVAARTNIDQSTIQFDLEVPPGATVADTEPVAEIYIIGKDVDNNDFLLGVANPENVNLYNNSGQTTLRVQIQIENADLTGLFTFSFTQAAEISTHNTDPNAHQDIRDNLEKAGIFEQLSLHEFIGQNFDERANEGGVSGRLLDGSVITGDVVYLDVDDVYKQAISNGTAASKVKGIANLTRGAVYNSGWVEVNHGFSHNTVLYLSETNPGKITSIPSAIRVGEAVTPTILDLRIEEVTIKEEAEIIVSDEIGYNHYPTIQEAIDSAVDGDTIRVEKLEEVPRTARAKRDRNGG